MSGGRTFRCNMLRVALACLALCAHGMAMFVLETVNQYSSPVNVTVSSRRLAVLQPGSSKQFPIASGSRVLISLNATVLLNETLHANENDGYQVLVWSQVDGSPAVSSISSRFSKTLEDGFNTARLRILNLSNITVNISGITSECWNCRMLPLCTLSAGEMTNRRACGPATIAGAQYLVVDARHNYIISITSDENKNGFSYQASLNLQEYSVSTLPILPTATGSGVVSSLITDYKGIPNWPTMLIGCVVLAALGMGYRLGKAAYHKSIHLENEDDDLKDRKDFIVRGKSVSLKPRTGSRIMGVDTFRGICLIIMVWVNYGGGGFWYMNHSRWNGLTVADLVFPWFMWLMGVSMALSMNSQRRQLANKWHLSAKLVFRAVKLFALGLFINNGHDLENWRITGVLQYFAVSTLVNGLLDVWMPLTSAREGAVGTIREGALSPHYYESLDESIAQQAAKAASTFSCSSLWADFRDAVQTDLWPYIFHYVFMSAVLITYMLIQAFLVVPGCPINYIGPGGLSIDPAQANCTGGAHSVVLIARSYIDKLVLGPHHMYHGTVGVNEPVSSATCVDTYHCGLHDPEGILGMLTASVITFCGVQAGRVIVSYKNVSPMAMIKRWLCWGLILCAIATLLCQASQNDGLYPINKNLWSPSFIALMAGLGCLTLSLIYFVVDYRRWWKGTPFRYVGMNSIAIYAGSEILQHYFPFTIMDHTSMDTSNYKFLTHEGALASNFVALSVWCAFAMLLRQHNVVISL